MIVQQRIAVKAGIDIDQEQKHRRRREADAPVLFLHHGSGKFQGEEDLGQEDQDAEDQHHGCQLFPARVSSVFNGVGNLQRSSRRIKYALQKAESQKDLRPAQNDLFHVYTIILKADLSKHFFSRSMSP